MNCAPCITRLFSGHLACPVPEKGASGTEYPFRTVEACFLHRMPQKMRRVPQEPVFCTARIFRTVGGPLRYRILRMPEKRRALPATNLSNCQKREGHGPEHDPECRREQENNSRHPQNTNALHNLPVTTATHPTTSIHSHPPATTATHSANKKHLQHPQSPPQAVRKVRFSKCNRPSGYSGRGRTNRRGTFRTGSPTGTKKEAPTECYFNRDFRKAAAAYSPTWWGSTIGASELNFSVRYGKRWILTAITAAVCYLREISCSEVLAYSKDLGLLVQVD